MKISIRPIVAGVLLSVSAFWPTAARAQAATPGPCIPGALPSGALSLVCVPSAGWNGQLVVFAHGYVAVGQPIGFYHLTLGNLSLPLLVQSQGFAFATTSFRQNGLAILEGADDIQELVFAFTTRYGVPVRTQITGVSEGGLIAALLLERSPELFSSGLSACGPVGSFRAQVNYVGDFRVLFDYFFPGVLPGTAIDVPPDAIANWLTQYLPAVQRAIQAHPARAIELMRTAKAAYDPANPATIVQTAANVLWYSVFGTADATDKLGGNPFGNQRRLYFGSSNDLRLNLRVQRFAASPIAVAEMTRYETSGQLTRPLVTLHTTGDEVVPFWHEPLYAAKVFLTGHRGLIPLPVDRYGHCNLTTDEILTSFALAVR